MADLEDIPHHVQLSLNLNGSVERPRMDEKMNWIKQHIKRMPHLGLVHFQETHFMTEREAYTALRRLGGKVLGLGLASDRGGGIATWVPPTSPVYELISEAAMDPECRYAVMQIQGTDSRIHTANLYAYPQPVEREEQFKKLKEDRVFHSYENLMIGGDWNFVLDEIDVWRRVHIE